MLAGHGPNQQQILHLLRDEMPRTCRQISEQTGIELSRVCNTIAGLDRHSMIRYSGIRGEHNAKHWAIDDAGRDLLDKTEQ
ncbi:hypothetical protein [Nocardia sp. BMG51109]|uniref:hypothetical protein n=1 Tax=Nocardia sp. BMG51109 TaxID=1056816 RepID=UPI0004AE5607|nr:hypothetical protein [Nocardia sp. BMG51109]